MATVMTTTMASYNDMVSKVERLREIANEYSQQGPLNDKLDLLTSSIKDMDAETYAKTFITLELKEFTDIISANSSDKGKDRVVADKKEIREIILVLVKNMEFLLSK